MQDVPESNLLTSHKVIGRAAADYEPVKDSISAVSVSKTAVSSFLCHYYEEFFIMSRQTACKFCSPFSSMFASAKAIYSLAIYSLRICQLPLW